MQQTLSIAEAQAIIATPKATASPMQWQQKPAKFIPPFVQYASVLKIHNEIHEDLYLRTLYRASHRENKHGAILEQDESIAVGLFAGNNRIAAIDYDTNKPHKNSKGENLPHFGKTLVGLHRHIWTTDGYGYAEPLELTEHSLETIITLFAQENNITLQGGYISPFTDSQQLDLFT